MTTTLTLEKKEIRQEIFRQDVVTIRFLSKLIGNLVAAFSAVILGPFSNVLTILRPRHYSSPMETVML